MIDNIIRHIKADIFAVIDSYHYDPENIEGCSTDDDSSESCWTVTLLHNLNVLFDGSPIVRSLLSISTISKKDSCSSLLGTDLSIFWSWSLTWDIQSRAASLCDRDLLIIVVYIDLHDETVNYCKSMKKYIDDASCKMSRPKKIELS